ncbi:hypothetical protein [uncultured Winogradskyella sp.]|uniref:hypothetical protein n=1 Tax=uncultured Winogradskyella sp. TaxID=395353 RepID=UPI002621581A|nr:hypothetical protein [uncultured Winogradskyella sp.]
MKRVIYLLGIFLIALNFSSCNPESLTDEVAPLACCGEGEEIPPPPPPPDPDPNDPPGGTGG